MRNQPEWKPGKYSLQNGGLAASKDTAALHVGSRLYANLTAGFFDRYIKKYACGKLIDLGCGDVPLFPLYRHLVDEIVCADWATSTHVDFRCDLSQAFPLRSSSFDTIILSDVLEHIPSGEMLWNEMSRILKPGGRVILSTPFYYGIHASPYDYFRFTAHALRRFAKSANLEIIVLDPLGGTPEILADLFAKHAAAIPVIGKLLSVLAQSIALAFVRRGFGKWLSKKTSLHFPIGYFLVAEKNCDHAILRP